jgi:2-oxoglutarate dehydrogenase E2 component (dihydrolipoamide succinyltransferase)
MAELEQIHGTGNEGRVTKKDILNYVENRGARYEVRSTKQESEKAEVRSENRQSSIVNRESAIETKQPQPETENRKQETEEQQPETFYGDNVEVIEMDRMRKLIAKHMVNSKQTSAHVTSFAEADVTNMVLWREKNKKEFEKQNSTKITYTPMFIDCIIHVMKRYPIINSSVMGDKIIVKKDFNIGMATALPNSNLIVPVIKNADELNLVGLTKRVNNLANAARNNQLKPDDTQDGTFTLTNVGTFGSLMGTPIINQPQVAILAVGAIKKRAVVIETEQGDTIGIRHMMYLSLSYDHRIVDGSVGASFLTAVAKEFENWDLSKGW